MQEEPGFYQHQFRDSEIVDRGKPVNEMVAGKELRRELDDGERGPRCVQIHNILRIVPCPY